MLKIAKKLNESLKQIEDAMSKIQQNVNKQNDYILETTKMITQEYLNSYKEDFQERINNEKAF